ncbi:hypothetical protein GC175_31905 [bacterium]|nr:hypothetical protein [bacterium]
MFRSKRVPIVLQMSAADVARPGPAPQDPDPRRGHQPVDAATEAAIHETLERLQSTCLIVAHRLGTVRGADRILLLDRGRTTN